LLTTAALGVVTPNDAVTTGGSTQHTIGDADVVGSSADVTTGGSTLHTIGAAVVVTSSGDVAAREATFHASGAVCAGVGTLRGRGVFTTSLRRPATSAGPPGTSSVDHVGADAGPARRSRQVVAAGQVDDSDFRGTGDAMDGAVPRAGIPAPIAWTGPERHAKACREVVSLEPPASLYASQASTQPITVRSESSRYTTRSTNQSIVCLCSAVNFSCFSILDCKRFAASAPSPSRPLPISRSVPHLRLLVPVRIVRPRGTLKLVSLLSRRLSLVQQEFVSSPLQAP